MQSKTRVEYYEKLRKEISKMDKYSFNSGNGISKSRHIDSATTIPLETLNTRVEEMLKENEENKKKLEEKRNKKLYKEKKKESKEKYLSQGKLLILIFTPCLLLLITFIILICLEVL